MAGSPVPSFLAGLEELRQRVAEAERTGADRAELGSLRAQLEAEAHRVSGSLSPWQQCLLARHSERPYMLDYVRGLFTDWVEVHGDRSFGDDTAIVAGFARFDGESLAVVGHQKGRDTKDRLHRNFGQPRPEGYRKALRVMKMAEKFGLPVVSIIDTPGAYPGLDAEERGQAEAIARNLREIGVGDKVMMLEHSIYSVISPEGCAAILWKDQSEVQKAASALSLTSKHLLELGVIDEIIPEPLGGAHMDPALSIRTVGTCLRKALRELRKVRRDELPRRRLQKFRAIGKFVER
jgi:acetyl-CoA carboxylase carboxyl transferase subunit alpha